jgi:hypothetical protein
VRHLPFIQSVYSEIDVQFEAVRIEATGRRDVLAQRIDLDAVTQEFFQIQGELKD